MPQKICDGLDTVHHLIQEIQRIDEDAGTEIIETIWSGTWEDLLGIIEDAREILYNIPAVHRPDLNAWKDPPRNEG